MDLQIHNNKCSCKQCLFRRRLQAARAYREMAQLNKQIASSYAGIESEANKYVYAR